MGLAAALFALLFFLHALPAMAVPPDAPRSGALVTDGPVRAIAHASGRTYIGGDFTRVGRRSGSGAVLSAAGAPRTFPEVAGGDVRAAVPDRAGGWYIGGTFTSVGGQTRIGLAHIVPGSVDGTYVVDPAFEPQVRHADGDPAEVNALALSIGPGPSGERTLYVGGLFSWIGIGTRLTDLRPRTNLAALKADTGVPVGSFAPTTACDADLRPACRGSVDALVLTDVPVSTNATQPVLFVGGRYSQIGPDDGRVGAEAMAAVWGVGATDTTGTATDGGVISWFPDIAPGGGAPDAAVLDVAVGHVVQAGGFAAMAVYVVGWRAPSAGAPPEPLALAYQFRLNQGTRAPGTAAQFANWNPSPGGCTRCATRGLAIDGTHVYLGGDFTRVGTTEVSHLAKATAIANPGATASAVPAPVVQPLGALPGPVNSLALHPARPAVLLAGGAFEHRLLALDTAAGDPVAGWTSPQPDTEVQALAADTSTSSIYAGGDFRSLGAVARRGLAAFGAGGELLEWAPDVDPGNRPRIHALAASDTTVYVGGRFGAADGGHANLSAINAGSGEVLPQFDPDPSKESGDSDVLALSLAGATLYVGGAFDRIGGHSRDNLAALHAGTGAVTSWNPGVTGDAVPAVRAILPACSAVYVGGWFDRAGGQPRRNLVALDPGNGTATAWDPSADGAVLALAHSGDTIYAGGTFTNVGRAYRQKVAGLHVMDGSATPFDARIDANRIGASVRALAATDAAVYIGGIFLNIGREPRSYLGAATPNTGDPTPWNPGADSRIDALSVNADAVHAGGEFTALDTSAQRGLAFFGPGAGSALTSPGCDLTRQAFGAEAVPAVSSPQPTHDQQPTVTRPRQMAPVRIDAVTASPRVVRLAGRPLTVRFSASRASLLRLTFARLVRTRRGRRYVKFGEATTRARRGTNRLTFKGNRVGARRLRPGRYRLTLSPVPPGSVRATPGAPVVVFVVRSR